MGAENSAVVVDLPRCGPMLSPRVPNLVPIPSDGTSPWPYRTAFTSSWKPSYRTYFTSDSMAVPVKKSGLPVAKSSTGFSNVIFRKSSPVIRPRSTAR